jgi:hypothetical protein
VYAGIVYSYIGIGELSPYAVGGLVWDFTLRFVFIGMSNRRWPRATNGTLRRKLVDDGCDFNRPRQTSLVYQGRGNGKNISQRRGK